MQKQPVSSGNAAQEKSKGNKSPGHQFVLMGDGSLMEIGKGRFTEEQKQAFDESHQ